MKHRRGKAVDRRRHPCHTNRQDNRREIEKELSFIYQRCFGRIQGKRISLVISLLTTPDCAGFCHTASFLSQQSGAEQHASEKTLRNAPCYFYNSLHRRCMLISSIIATPKKQSHIMETNKEDAATMTFALACEL